MKVPAPPRVWGPNYIRTVYETNAKTKPRNTEGVGATSANFGRERAEFLDRAAYHIRGGTDFTEPLGH